VASQPDAAQVDDFAAFGHPGAGFNRLLVAAFGDAKIEDLPTPFFCVTTDLTTSSGFVHRNGSMWRSVLLPTCP